MGDNVASNPPNQHNRLSHSLDRNNSSNSKDRGYTIVVPANVLIGGVSMQLDLKIDQKTLAAASDISKAVEEAVSTHFHANPATTSTTCSQTSTSSARRIVRLPSSSHSFSLTEPQVVNSTRMDCDCSMQNNTNNQSAVAGESREQVNEVCSSTVDSSPRCDTASSPIQLDSAPSTSAACSHVGLPQDDQRPSSSKVSDNEVHSSVSDSGEPSASRSTVPGGSEGTGPSQSPASSSLGPSPSPRVTVSHPPPKRRRDKSTPPSHFCEQNDPGGRGQCRQRAILSYRFCIRHILLDPNAPYRQCQHKRKPKSKKDTNLLCTNAVRSDKDSMYCSTHMIMNGMMEPRRKKNANATNGVARAELIAAPSIAQPTPSTTTVSWRDTPAVMTPQQQTPQTPLQPLPSIMHCGFEQSQQRCLSEEADRWMVDSCGSVNSPMLSNDVPPPSTTEPFPGKQPLTPQSSQQFESVVNTVVYPPAPQASTSLIHRNASCPPSVPPPSNLSSASYDEPYSLPANTPQVMEDSPCSSSMMSPSPSKHGLNAPQPHQLHQSASVSNLTKQHPQLAAKLLQTSSISSGSYTTSLSTPLQSSSGSVSVGNNCSHPAMGNSTTSVGIPIGTGPVGGVASVSSVSVLSGTVNGTATAPSTVTQSCNRVEYSRSGSVSSPANTPQNAILPWSAPLLLQRAPSVDVPKHYCLEDLDDEETTACSPPPPKKKVIRLKQKRQRMKMVGAYRKIPAVEQMCKVLEDADFDRTDLFPLGLEPSDDESSESDSDIMQRWPTPMERRCDDNSCRSSGALEVYLLKKQLRLDRHTLLRQAQLNAPVMLASKKYPNSAGAALNDRGSRCGTKRSTFVRRCTHVLTNACGEAVQCTEACLPMSNHCAQHALYNINQKLFSYCSESCCGQPVLCVNSVLTSGLCQYHFELSQKEEKPDVEDLAEDSIHPIGFIKTEKTDPSPVAPPPPYTPLQRELPLTAFSTTDLPAGNIQRSVSDTAHIADFNESEGVETDVSLASVAKELGFDGRELSDMLADLPADEADTDDILHQHFSQGLKEEEVAVAEMDDLGHSWADVEQFLLSEGYPVDLTPPPISGIDSPTATQTVTSSSLPPSCGGYLTTPSPTMTPSPGGLQMPSSQSHPRMHTIPTAETLLPHRS